MKLAVQFVSDAEGNTQAVQLPISDWKKLLNKLRKYEQSLQLRSELQGASDQVAALQKPGAKKNRCEAYWMSYDVIPVERFKREDRIYVRCIKQLPALPYRA